MVSKRAIEKVIERNNFPGFNYAFVSGDLTITIWV